MTRPSTRSTRASTTAFLASALLAGAASLSATALAQTPQEPPEPKYSADTAAGCLVTFDWMLEYMSPKEGQEVTEQAMRAQQINNLAAAMWDYELRLATMEMEEADIEALYVSSAEGLVNQFPTERNEDSVKQIVEIVMGEATRCGELLQTEYPSGTHPVIQAMQAQAAQQQQMQMQQQQGGQQ